MQMSRLFPLAQRQLNSTQINPSMQSLYSIFRLISDRDGLRDSMVSRFLDDSHWILIGFSLDSLGESQRLWVAMNNHSICLCLEQTTATKKPKMNENVKLMKSGLGRIPPLLVFLLLVGGGGGGGGGGGRTLTDLLISISFRSNLDGFIPGGMEA